jgi:DNA polymerase IIIc chi subunit
MIETKKIKITTPLNRSPETPIVVQLSIKFSAMHGNLKFISVFRKLPENKHKRKQVRERVNSVTSLAPSLSFV